VSDKWPWPGDTQLDRARRIANSLLTLLPGDEQPMWQARAHGLGETWLGEDLIRWSVDDVVTTQEAAAILHVSDSTIRKWHSEGDLPNVRRGRYRVGAVIDCSAERRRRRERKAV
jgi:excisionase family DNA binding protein